MDRKESFPPWRCVLEGGCGELVEKKSRFLATVQPVENEEEASAFIEEMKKKYWDASHNCSAFVIGRRAELTRCSDDGEPSGTAGRPMLEVLLKEGLKNCEVATMRYGTRLQVKADYPDVGRIQHLAAREGIVQESAEYGADVRFVFAALAENEERVIKSLTEATDARARIEVLSRGYYADRD